MLILGSIVVTVSLLSDIVSVLESIVVLSLVSDDGDGVDTNEDSVGVMHVLELSQSILIS